MAILALSVSKIAATYAVRHAEDVRSLMGSSSRSSLSLGGRLSTTRTPCSRVPRVRGTLLVVGASGLAYFSFGWVPHVALIRLSVSMEIQESQGCGALFELCVSTLEYTRQRVLFLRGRDGPDLPTT